VLKYFRNSFAVSLKLIVLLLLKSVLEDLQKLLLNNGIISFNINDVLNRNKAIVTKLLSVSSPASIISTMSRSFLTLTCWISRQKKNRKIENLEILHFSISQRVIRGHLKNDIYFYFNSLIPVYFRTCHSVLMLHC